MTQMRTTNCQTRHATLQHNDTHDNGKHAEILNKLVRHELF